MHHHQTTRRQHSWRSGELRRSASDPSSERSSVGMLAFVSGMGTHRRLRQSTRIHALWCSVSGKRAVMSGAARTPFSSAMSGAARSLCWTVADRKIKNASVAQLPWQGQ